MYLPHWHLGLAWRLGSFGWLVLVAVLVLAGASVAWRWPGVWRIAGTAACSYGVWLVMVMAAPRWFLPVGLVGMAWPWW